MARLLAPLLLVCLLLSQAQAVTSHRAQSTFATSPADQFSYSATFVSNASPPSFIEAWCFIIQQDAFSISDAAFSDDHSNAYTVAINEGVDDPTSNIGRVYMAYVQNAASGSITVTCDPPGNGAYISIVIVEYTGMLTIGAFDKTAVNSSGDTPGTAVTSGTTATTSQASEVVTAGMTYRNTPNATITESGYDLVQEGEDEATYASFSVVDKEVSSTGTQSASWTLSGSHRWAAAIATAKITVATLARKVGAIIFP